MTVTQSIISWLKTFKQEETWKMKDIDTDIQPAKVKSYALVKEPIINKKTSISGKITATEHYTLMARLDSQTDSDRKANNTWGIDLEEWVENKNRNKEWPILENGQVRSISVTTPFYLGEAGISESVYQLTISITYVKEKEQRK